VRSWIDLGFISFQPAEIAKLSTVLVVARLLSQRENPLASLKDLMAPSALVALPLGLVRCA
jgi:rod shape determining protein RodA